MSIISKVGIDATGYKVKLDKKLRFYKGDCLNLSFSISNSMISEIDSQEVINGMLPVDSEKVKVYILAGNEKKSGTIITDNRVVFKLNSDYTKDVGIFQLQLVIIELQEDGSKEILHTPPFEYEVAEPIALFDEDLEEDIARVGYAVVGRSVVAGNSITYAEVELGYEEWKTGDLITADKLNRIEAAIYEHTKQLDELLYKAISITNFSLSKTTAELGEVIKNLKATWTYNKAPISQKFNGITLDASIRSYDILDEITTNKSFSLSATDGKTTVNRTASINFYNGRYHGVSAEGSYDSEFVMKLTKTLTNNRQNTFSVSCGDGQYVYFAIPTRFGTPTFSVGGFSGGFVKVSTLNFTNKFGYTEPYDIWKSENSNLGKITVVVG